MNIYETHHFKDPRLPFIFHNYMTCLPDNTNIGGNWHENIEILYIIKGTGSITLNTDKICVSSGDIVVVNSNVLHKIASDNMPLVFHCLIVDRSFCLANSFDTNDVRFAEKQNDKNIGRLMELLSTEFSNNERCISDIMRIRAYVLEIMAIMYSEYCTEHIGEHSEAHSLTCLKQAIAYIRSSFTEDLSLDTVADFVGLSKYYFSHEFRRITDHTFVEYINILRCEKAKELLLTSKLTVAEVGQKCGFQNRAYFTRTFARYTKLTPSEYRSTNG